MKSFGWVLTHLVPYKKAKFGLNGRYQVFPPTGRSHRRSQKEESHLQAKERSLRRNQTYQYLDLGLTASRAVRK